MGVAGFVKRQCVAWIRKSNVFLVNGVSLVETQRGLGGGGGVKFPIHFHCVLHAKRGRGGSR